MYWLCKEIDIFQSIPGKVHKFRVHNYDAMYSSNLVPKVFITTASILEVEATYVQSTLKNPLGKYFQNFNFSKHRGTKKLP